MKKQLLVLVAFIVLFSNGANAQFKFGVKATMPFTIENFNLSAPNTSTMQLETKQPFNFGVTAEGIIPVLGLGIEASGLLEFSNANINMASVEKSFNQGYCKVPIYLKYKMGLPIMSNFLKVYAYLGPYFNFKIYGDVVTLESFNAQYNGIDFTPKSMNWGMNYGVGFEVLKHVQVSVGYTHSVGSAFEFDATMLNNMSFSDDFIDSFGKSNGWFVSAAYLF